MCDCFISYSRKDKEFALEIVKALKKHKISCWIDNEGISFGVDWPNEIPKAIKEARIFLLIISEDSCNSNEVAKEVHISVTAEKIILPIKIDDCALGKLEYDISRYNWFDASQPPVESHIPKIVELVQEKLRQPSSKDIPEQSSISAAQQKECLAAIDAFSNDAFIQRLYDQFGNERKGIDNIELEVCARTYDKKNINRIVTMFEKLDKELEITKNKYIRACREALEELDRLQKIREKEIQTQQQAQQIAEQKKKKREKALVPFVVIAVLLAIIGGKIWKTNEEEKMYSASNVVLSVLDKVEATQNSSYTDGCITALKILIQNNGQLDIDQIEGQMQIYNASGELLIATNCTFTGTFLSGSESNLVLNIDNRASEEAIAFYYADYEDLQIKFRLTQIIYDGGESKSYREDYITILELSKNSDGISEIEKNYQKAVALAEQGQYAEAILLFEKIGNYKDGADYHMQCVLMLESTTMESQYNQALSYMSQEKYSEALEIFSEIIGYKDTANKVEELYTIVEQKAEGIAATGNYIAARDFLGDLGYTNSNSSLYKAYSLAISGDFVAAVQNGLTVLVIPEGTTVIPDNYLKDASYQYALKKVVLPESVKSIGEYAFAGCTKLEEINLPDGLLAISAFAFKSCSRLSAITLPESVISIGQSAFSSCSQLQEVHLPKNLQHIGDSAFSHCRSLTSIALPASLLTIGKRAFSYCEGLVTVTIPSKVKSIENATFECCARLVSVTLSEGVETIGPYAFYRCTALTNLHLPDSLLTIEDHAIFECTALAEVTIPKNVNSIATLAFGYCSSLQRVYFANTEGWLRAGYFEYDASDAQKNARSLVQYQESFVRK